MKSDKGLMDYVRDGNCKNQTKILYFKDSNPKIITFITGSEGYSLITESLNIVQYDKNKWNNSNII